MKEWNEKSLLRILRAVDPELLKKCLLQVGLEETKEVDKFREINNFLLSLIPIPWAEPLGDLFQKALDWVIEQDNLILDNSTIDSCKNYCSYEIENVKNKLNLE